MKKKYSIKSKYFALLLLTFMVACPDVHAETKTKVTQILEKVVENHKPLIEGMTVPYEREILTKSMAMLGEDAGADKATGIFIFRGPHFLKVEQETPKKEFIISNGKSIWDYIPDEKTAYRDDNVGTELSSVLSMIFMGLKNPEDSFDVSVAESEDVKGYTLTLTPKESMEGIEYINITISDEDYKITMVELLDVAGNITRFKLGEFKPKNGLDDSFFDFKVPDDVKIIEEE